MPIVIDRFDGDYAVCETGSGCEPVYVPRIRLPAFASEGDALVLSEDGVYASDAACTATLRKEAQRRLAALLHTEKE